MSTMDALVQTYLLLAPHRQQLLLDTALALLDLQLDVDTGFEPS